MSINLREHIDTVHINNRDFHCDDCSKSFGCLSTLSLHRRHLHNFTNVDWLYCPIDGCDIKQKRMGDLNRHIKQKHPNEEE